MASVRDTNKALEHCVFQSCLKAQVYRGLRSPENSVRTQAPPHLGPEVDSGGRGWPSSEATPAVSEHGGRPPRHSWAWAEKTRSLSNSVLTKGLKASGVRVGQEL